MSEREHGDFTVTIGPHTWCVDWSDDGPEFDPPASKYTATIHEKGEREEVHVCADDLETLERLTRAVVQELAGPNRDFRAAWREQQHRLDKMRDDALTKARFCRAHLTAKSQGAATAYEQAARWIRNVMTGRAHYDSAETQLHVHYEIYPTKERAS